MRQRRLAALGLAVALPAFLGLGLAEAKPFPKDPAEARSLKAQGVRWTNEEIRDFYVRTNDGVPAQNEAWKAQGKSAEARARLAYEIRHNARLTSRAMMSSRLEVLGLQIRDFFKYLSVDGPSFDALVRAARKKGLTGDAVYEEIIGSAQRTNETVNRWTGVDRKK
jgi:hypothetical protein